MCLTLSPLLFFHSWPWCALSIWLHTACAAPIEMGLVSLSRFLIRSEGGGGGGESEFGGEAGAGGKVGGEVGGGGMSGCVSF
tara:strand:- start:453 stop:698 length:246 start_codon:yes stop_codon:yes gene_type:complete